MRIARLIVLALVLSLTLPAAAFAADSFIAQSSELMTWAEAQKFCESKGGKLPLVDNAEALEKPDKGTPVDGFGAFGDKWPDGLPDVAYWTGTTAIGQPFSSYGVNTNRGTINIYHAKQFGQNRVVCVPK